MEIILNFGGNNEIWNLVSMKYYKLVKWWYIYLQLPLLKVFMLKRMQSIEDVRFFKDFDSQEFCIFSVMFEKKKIVELQQLLGYVLCT